MSAPSQQLAKTLGPFTIWGLGVGYVISGIYFGWNLGLPLGGPLGLLIATIVVTIMYVCFVLCYAELASAMPKAGGAFVYASRAFGPGVGFLAGMAQILEFLFAPPAIALAIGAYFSLFFPGLASIHIAVVAYVLFTLLNIYGVKQAAIFELIITVFAVAELLVFIGFTAPQFKIEAFTQDWLPNGPSGILQALPFAIWFYLAIEGVANIAEEAKKPRTISLGFGLAMATLVILAFLTFFCAVGVGGWKAVVYASGGIEPSDSPLPMALGQIVGENNFFYHLLVSIGLFGLIASFHGILLAAGRATFEFGRAGCAPAFIGKTFQSRKTPGFALLVNAVIGIGALFTGRTSEMITLSVFGALMLYIVSMLSFFKLRKSQPQMIRPYRAPFFPAAPFTALLIALGSLFSMIYFNPRIALLFFAILLLAGIGYRLRSLYGRKIDTESGS